MPFVRDNIGKIAISEKLHSFQGAADASREKAAK
jgi:hypothetical protein